MTLRLRTIQRHAIIERIVIIHTSQSTLKKNPFDEEYIYYPFNPPYQQAFRSLCILMHVFQFSSRERTMMCVLKFQALLMILQRKKSIDSPQMKIKISIHKKVQFMFVFTVNERLRDIEIIRHLPATLVYAVANHNVIVVVVRQ